MSVSGDNCIFCKIANGEIATELVASSENVVAFNDIEPIAPTHVLVVPRAHVQSAQHLDENHAGTWQEMLNVVQQVAETNGVAETGYRLVTNIGPDSGQEVPHLHIHLIGGRKLGHLG